MCMIQLRHMSPGPAKQFSRDKVLGRALELFWSQGYEATGMAQLIDHMGIGRQSLYDTFGDKRALFIAALESYARLQSEPIFTRLEAPGSAIVNVKSVFRFWQEMVAHNECKGCLLVNMSAEFGAQDDEVLGILHGCREKIENAFYKAFERARKEGELVSGTNTRNLARLVMSTSQGLALYSKLNKGQAYIRSVLDTLTDLLPVK